MSEKKFDKYYIDSKNANRMKNILQFVNNCEFNNINQSYEAQTKSSQYFSNLLKKYFNGQFKFSDLLKLKNFTDNYNTSVCKYLFNEENEIDPETTKPSNVLEEIFQISIDPLVKDSDDSKYFVTRNLAIDEDCFYTRLASLNKSLEIPIGVGDVFRYTIVSLASDLENIKDYDDTLKNILQTNTQVSITDNPYQNFLNNFLNINNLKIEYDDFTNVVTSSITGDKLTILKQAFNEYFVSYILKHFIFSNYSIDRVTNVLKDKYYPNDVENRAILARQPITPILLEFSLEFNAGKVKLSDGTEISIDTFNQIFGYEYGSSTSGRFTFSAQILYKELNNYFREISKATIFETLVGIFLLNKTPLNIETLNKTPFKIGTYLKIYDNKNLYEWLKLENVSNMKYSLLFNNISDNNYTLYKYFNSNAIINNLAEDLDILAYVCGDNIVSGGFGNGIFAENSEASVNLFLEEYEKSKNYFMTVLHNYSYSSEKGYRSYAFLKIISMAISSWNDYFQNGIYNVDLYNEDDVNSFLRSFGLDNVAKSYAGTSDGYLKIKLIQNYLRLMQEKGTADVIVDIQNILSSETRVARLSPMYMSSYNPNISKKDNMFLINNDDSIVFFPINSGTNEIYNNIRKFLQNKKSFSEIVDNDPYWDTTDINEDLLKNNFNINAMSTKYLKYDISENTSWQHIMSSLLLSGALFDMNDYGSSDYKDYVIWCKRVVYLWELIAILYTERDRYQRDSNQKFPMEKDSREKHSLYKEWYAISGKGYSYLDPSVIQNILDEIFEGYSDLDPSILDDTDKLSNMLEKSSYEYNVDYVAFKNISDIFKDISDKDTFSNYFVPFINKIQEYVVSIDNMLNNSIVDPSSITHLINIRDTVYEMLTNGQSFPVISIYLKDDGTLRMFQYDNAEYFSEIISYLNGAIPEIIGNDDLKFESNSVNNNIINAICRSDGDVFKEVLNVIENLYFRQVQQVLSHPSLKDLYGISSYVDGFSTMKIATDQYQIFTDILANFLSYTIQILKENKDDGIKTFTDEYNVTDAFSFKIQTYVYSEKIDVIDEKIEFFVQAEPSSDQSQQIAIIEEEGETA